MSLTRKGRLVLVGTPIGNLDDITVRAADALRECQVLVCEDTRRASKLLNHVGGARPRLIVANEHTEFNVVADVLAALDSGESVLVTTDAGMPGISDPGSRLVEAAIAAGFIVDAAPGPTAMTVALVLSGLPTERFVFEGFLPRSGPERTERLGALSAEARTVILYEAPHRLERTLQDLVSVCGGARPACVARELTKRHQELQRGTLNELLAKLGQRQPRGEYVIVVAGMVGKRDPESDVSLIARIRSELEAGASRRDAVAAVTALTGEPKRRVYDLALTID